MYARGITILPREDSVMGKSLKKLIKGQCPLRDMATAWELSQKENPEKTQTKTVTFAKLYFPTFSNFPYC